MAVRLSCICSDAAERHKSAELSELKAAADRLAQALADVDEEELVTEFKEVRRRSKGGTR